MPITDQFPRVALDRIQIPRTVRQRQQDRLPDGRVDTKGLQASISRVGVLMPLLVEVVDQDGEPWWFLLAGERRLQSCLNLVEAGSAAARNGQDLTTVPIRLATQLDRVDSRIIELEENVKRQDLGWIDIVRSTAELHQLFKSRDPEWTLGETGEALSLTTGIISMYLRVHSGLGDQRINEAGSVREAYNTLVRRDQRALGDALDELAEVPIAVQLEGDGTVGEQAIYSPDELTPQALAAGVILTPGRVLVPASAFNAPSTEQESILNESFLEWAPKYSGQPFNLIHCDFPYGIEVFSGPQGLGSEPTAGYEDSLATYTDLLDCLCMNIDRLMSMSGHLMFWYSGKHEALTRQTFARLASSLSFTTFPLIWHKSDDKGIAADYRHQPRHVYETCLLASRGQRQILQVKSDLYSSPTDKSLHASTKPEPMLRHFMSMLADGNTRLLDPTCGSGAALRAGESLGARVLGLEIDLETCRVARKALRDARTLRAASREL